MTIKQFHDSARQMMNIGQGQYYPPEDLDLALNNAINGFYNQEYKHFEATQYISDTLGFFKKVTDPITLDSNNQGDIPTDLHHITGAEVILDNDDRIECEVLKDAYWLKRKHSKAFPPSDEYPIARQVGSLKVEVLPANAKSIILMYLKKPAIAVYGYDVDAGGSGWVYNQAKSVEVDWPSIAHTDILNKMVSILGIGLRDPDLIRTETVRRQQNERK